MERIIKSTEGFVSPLKFSKNGNFFSRSCAKITL